MHCSLWLLVCKSQGCRKQSGQSGHGLTPFLAGFSWLAIIIFLLCCIMAWLMSGVWSLPEVDEQPNQPMWFKFPKHQFGKTKVVNCSFSEPVVQEVVLVSLRWILGPYLYWFQSQFCLITASEVISEYPILKIYWWHMPSDLPSMACLCTLTDEPSIPTALVPLSINTVAGEAMPCNYWALLVDSKVFSH